MAHAHDHSHASQSRHSGTHDHDHAEPLHQPPTAAPIRSVLSTDSHADDSPNPAHPTHHAHTHHDHQHAPANYDRAFAFGVVLNVAFVLIEAVCGVLSGSLALLADAGHNLSDVLALALAWGAVALGRRLPTARRTYGWRRSSILAALANAVALVAVVGAVSWEAFHRLLDPQPVEGGLMIAVAAIGVLVNGACALLFMERGHHAHEGGGGHHDANVRAAFLHLASDAAVSVGVVVAGLAILLTGWLWLDPAISLAISAVILVSTWGLLRDALDLALDAVPSSIDERRVRRYLEGLPSVVEVHDLHIWAMSTTQTALTAHLVMHELPRGDGFLCQVADELTHHFTIEHPTLQLELGDPEHPCELAPIHLV